jgi:hypothetical protein
MKKIAYLFVLMFSLILYTNCEKSGADDNSNNTTSLIINDLIGVWNFTSLETFNASGALIMKYDNTSYYIQRIKNDGINYGALNLNFKVQPNRLNIRELNATPPDVNGYDYDITIDANKMIHCSANQSDELVFKIKELNSAKTELKLQLMSSKVVQNTPSPSSIYTFNK